MGCGYRIAEKAKALFVMERIRVEPMSWIDTSNITRRENEQTSAYGNSLQDSLQNLLKKGKQMNAKKLACAPEDIDIHELWSEIDWNKCECFVQKLQARIVKAQREGRYNKVKALQWMLTHSFYAKALAVKRVTTNKGKSTSGVDKEIWSSPLAKPEPYSVLKDVATVHNR